MAMTASQASDLAGEARRHIHIVSSIYPQSLVTMSVVNIHWDRPLIQVRIQKIHSYKVIYIPCVILGSTTRIMNGEYYGRII